MCFLLFYYILFLTFYYYCKSRILEKKTTCLRFPTPKSIPRPYLLQENDFFHISLLVCLHFKLPFLKISRFFSCGFCMAPPRKFAFQLARLEGSLGTFFKKKFEHFIRGGSFQFFFKIFRQSG